MSDRFERLSDQIMNALAVAVDAKDSYTNGHSHRVAKYSMDIARRLGCSKEEQKDIYRMGLLHDIGKIGIPDAIIQKASSLTDDEYNLIQSHPVIGFNILKEIHEIPGLSTGAKYHHEHFDGSGYPEGLKGQEIPLEARIIGIADAYDAMTSKRTYNQIRPQNEVREELLKGSGTQFDPALVQIVVQMIDEDKNYELRQPEEGN